MKRFFSKSLSVIISIVFVISAISLCFPSFASNDVKGTDIPLVYVVGQGSALCVYEDGVRRDVYPVKFDTDAIMQAAKDNIDVFAKALVTQKWTEFGNVVRDVLTPIFSEIALDENGESPNGVRSKSQYTYDSVKNKKKVDGKYPTRTFTFYYDWRQDPYKTADELHQYIEYVVQATGYDKVALSGRCEGSCITAAYMEKYDCEYISDYIQYSSAVNGATVLSKCFAGDIDLDADAVERFVYDLDISADELTNQLIESFVTVFNKTYGMNLACWAVNNVWDDIYLDIMPQILIETFGTWPGFWSMVNDEDYNRAKENVFHNADMEKWSSFIDIIDNYHYNVQVKQNELLKEYSERGIDVYNITKYGYQTLPISEPADVLSDSYVTVYNGSFGANTTTLNTQFSDDYLAQAEMNGTMKYISPDKQIDASTCLFPDKTWFIKNLPHKTFPDDPERLIDAMVNIDGFTVDTSENFPQYLVYIGDQMMPMTEENMDTTSAKYEHTFFEALKNLFEALFAYIKKAIAN